jgi:hypothetical protein
MVKQPDDLLPVATAATVEEAEIIRARLEAEGIPAFIPNAATTEWMPHMSIAINPYGVAVIVPAGRLEAARQVLDPGTKNPAPRGADGPAETDADLWARRAAFAAVFAWLFPPLAIYSFVCVFRAAKAKRLQAPINKDAYDRNVFAAVVVSIGLSAATTWAVWAALRCVF